MHVNPQEWLGLFVFHDQALTKTTRGFSDDQWLARVGDSNNAHWILGHLACCRRSALRRLGAELPAEPWEAVFGRGSSVTTALEPPVEPLRVAFAEAGAAIGQQLEVLEADDLEADSGRTWPTGSSTLGGMLAFMLHFHEPYHIGQLGLLARAAGHPGLA